MSRWWTQQSPTTPPAVRPGSSASPVSASRRSTSTVTSTSIKSSSHSCLWSSWSSSTVCSFSLFSRPPGSVSRWSRWTESERRPTRLRWRTCRAAETELERPARGRRTRTAGSRWCWSWSAWCSSSVRFQFFNALRNPIAPCYHWVNVKHTTSLCDGLSGWSAGFNLTRPDALQMN